MTSDRRLPHGSGMSRCERARLAGERIARWIEDMVAPDENDRRLPHGSGIIILLAGSLVMWGALIWWGF